MKKILIEGGNRLIGRVHISGAKNSVLPLIAATLLAEGKSIIDDCPGLSDVETMCRVLESLGADIHLNKEESQLSVDTTNVDCIEPPRNLMQQMRASILVMGPLLARCGKVRVCQPGGCAIGARPVNLHLQGLEALGAKLTITSEYIEAEAERLHGCPIYLEFPSVGATENLMMAAALAEGTTIIENAAHEPEIIDLSNLLNNMGAKIKGAGTNSICIEGVTSLHPARHTVIPDRIEAASFLAMAAATGSEMVIENLIPEHLQPILTKLQQCGTYLDVGYDSIHVIGNPELRPASFQTLPYPGFPTDAQAQFMALLAVADGVSEITETVFENRFMHAAQLNKMGANIRIQGNTAYVTGVKELHAAQVEATDLRAGAAMVIAALKAHGTTEIGQVHHIERGYEALCQKLEAIGGRVKMVDIP